ncbi:MAG: limonene-1,2-epoxide hydrolase family protein [Acidimicrobiia bacterium]
MGTTDSAIDVVTRFCNAWAKFDLDEIMGFFAEDAVYHNIPVEPAVGTDAIRTMIEGFLGGLGQVEFQVRHVVAAGDVVLTERVDVFELPNGRVELPVMGTFELRDGKITAWRDYFDLNQFMAQLPQA